VDGYISIIISQCSYFKGLVNSPYCKIYSWRTDAVTVLNYATYKEIFNPFSEVKWGDVHNLAASLLIFDVYSHYFH
jgi:hypothetical protein